MFKILDFNPFPGCASHHLQMIMANLGPAGKEPPYEPMMVALSDGDRLACPTSTPLNWKPTSKTIVLVHGVGGSHLSPYMIRLSRKFYHAGCKIVRINLRGCGLGAGLNQKTYHGGNSHDIWEVTQALKKLNPSSPICLLGFSLGGSLILKMGGELGQKATNAIERMVAVCPAIDLLQTSQLVSRKRNWLYHKYYLKTILEQGGKWAAGKKIKSMRDFDSQITAPLWGYKNADDYYEKCSPYNFISEIKVPCHVLMTMDDPFIDPYSINKAKIPVEVKPWLTTYGSHMGFIGYSKEHPGPYWMDRVLFNWIA